jgi:CheY-like chemotaxis protein
LGHRGEGEEARKTGIEAYLTKPVKQSQLYDALATVMGTPVEEEEARPEQQAHLVTRHSLEEAKARSRERLSRARLLVAEDNAVNQKVAVRMLKKLGYKADVVANGLEALEALSRVPYAAVLMDVQMPEMDGYEATAEIRHRERSEGGHTPVIAMTANAMQGDREKALEAGMDDYVAKPVKAEELEVALKHWVSQGTPELEASQTASGDGFIREDLEEDPLDRSVLTGLRELQEEGEPDILNELIELFLNDVPPHLKTLQEAVEGKDASSIERIAHTLKGSCGNMGATRMAELCEELQEVGGSGDLARAPKLLERLEAEFDCVRPALKAGQSGN